MQIFEPTCANAQWAHLHPDVIGEKVRLEIKEACYSRVSVGIPLHVWGGASAKKIKCGGGRRGFFPVRPP